MKIAIDIRDLKIAKTGINTYTNELIKAFKESNSNHELLLLDSQYQPFPRSSKVAIILNHILYYYWKEIELPLLARSQNCDVLLCTDYVVPLPLLFKGIRIPVFHDSTFWDHPEYYNKIWRILLNIFAVSGARSADFIITPSEFSKRSVNKHLKVNPDKVVVIPEGPKTKMYEVPPLEDVRSVRKKYDIPNETKYILHVGVFEKRKNLPFLIKVFAQLIHDHKVEYKLVLVGQKGPRKDMDDYDRILKTINEHGVKDHIIMTGYVTNEELGVLYTSADIYVFPSTREGFGLPILEAFASKIPVVSSISGSLPEVVGDAGLLFNPTDSLSLKNILLNLMNDDSLKLEMVNRGTQRLNNFSWSNTVKLIINELQKCERNL